MSKSHEQKILTCIAAIPAGKVAAYGQIASLAGVKRGHRVVARVLRQQNTEQLPWHRVLRADGYLGVEPGSAAFEEQTQRLRSEGVTVTAGRVAMNTFQWQPELDFFLFHPDL